jgi:hypothetical protein
MYRVSRWWLKNEPAFGDNRNELDEDEGAAMAAKIRACVERHFNTKTASLSSKM